LGTHVATAGTRRVDATFRDLAHKTAERYLAIGITAWEMARAKLLGECRGRSSTRQSYEAAMTL
jgi:hypothetical protein